MGRKLSLEEINGRTGADKLFPGKLHDMLDYAERENMEHIVSWTSDGTAFAVHKPKEMMQLLPMFFGHAKYRSFHRQLNMWSYRRVATGPNKGAFMHPFFLKGQKESCKTISRHRFRTAPLEEDSQRSVFKNPVSDCLKPEQTSLTRTSSQVSLESDGPEPILSQPSTFLKDGDALMFEGKTFHYVSFEYGVV